jgi:uncharacterized protein (DUF2461 family)
LIAGIWRPEPFLIKNIRKNIDENPSELQNILANTAIKNNFELR